MPDQRERGGNPPELSEEEFLQKMWEAGEVGYKNKRYSNRGCEVHFDPLNRVWANVPAGIARDRVPVKLQLDTEEILKRFKLIDSHVVKERVNAYIRGYGYAASQLNDFKTTLSAIDVVYPGGILRQKGEVSTALRNVVKMVGEDLKSPRPSRQPLNR